MSLCLIMARGGSKRVEGKNLKPLAGRPLVTWPVRTAVRSGLFGRVVISTDDAEIAAVACAAGAEQPFARPPELANDFATTTDVMHHAFSALQALDGTLQQACCVLYGTSFLVSADMLEAGRQCLMQAGVEAVMAVTSYHHPIERALHLDDNGRVHYLHPDVIERRLRTQDLPPAYHDTGLFYWVRTEEFMARKVSSFAELVLAAVVVPRLAAVDIDTPEDWDLAEVTARYRGLDGP